MSKDLSLKYGDIAIDFDDKESVKTYVRFSMLHINRFRQEIDNIKEIVCYQNMPDTEQLRFLKSLVSYERKHRYKYAKETTYKTICGINIELLLPRSITKRVDKIKVAERFMKKINPLAYRIPWIAYEETRGSATILKILLSEREFLDHEETKVYSRNYYDRSGNITHRKGDPVLKAGKPVKVKVLWSNKMRIFAFNKAYFKRLVGQLINHYIEVVKSILQKINVRFRIKQRTAKAKWHYYNRTVCMEINAMKQYVEFHCNYAVYLQREKSKNPYVEDYLERMIPVPKLKDIINVFHKYKARFDKGMFHDEQGEAYKIAYKQVPLPALRKNLDILKSEFRKELMQIVPKAFT